MKKFLLLLSPLLLLLATRSPAAPPAPAAPTLPGPLIQAKMPAYARWTTTYTYAGGGKDEAALNAGHDAAMKKMASDDPVLAKLLAAKPATATRKPRLQQRAAAKTGDVRLEVLVYTSGQRGERWQFKSSVVGRDAFTNALAIQPPVGEEESDFPEFAWIKPANFTGEKVVAGRKCLVFEGKVEPLQVQDPHLFAQIGGVGSEDASVPAVAAIDSETRLPVSLQCGDQTQKYEIQAAPTAALTLPPDVTALLQQVEKRAQARTAPLSRP